MADGDNEGKERQSYLDDLLSLSEAAAISGLSASHLRLLVRSGEIWGRKLV